jgi:hypothetical protein
MASFSVSGTSLAVLPVQSHQLVSDDLTMDRQLNLSRNRA